MKTLMIVVAACIFSFSAMAQNKTGNTGSQGDRKKTEKYCVMKKNGKMQVMSQDDKELKTDVTLKNGTKVKSDGRVIKKDGSETTLKEGECIDNSGQIITKSPKKDYNKKDYKKKGDQGKKGDYDKDMEYK